MEYLEINKKYIQKPEILIESKYHLNTITLKLINIIISNINLEQNNNIFNIKITNIIDILNTKNKRIYEVLKNATNELLKKSLQIKENNEWIKINWVNGIEYQNGKGLITIEIDKNLKKYLTLSKQRKIINYKINTLSKLRSSYSIRLYEILKYHYSIHKQKEKIINLNWIIDILQIPQKYRYNNIKIQILEKTKKDLEKLSDINFKFEEVKTGKKIEKIKFTIFKNEYQQKSS